MTQGMSHPWRGKLSDELRKKGEVKNAVVLHMPNSNHPMVWAQGQEMRRKHLQFDKKVMSIWECCELLNDCVDDSDPDLEEPQIEHLLQTAEAIRLDHPHDDWFHLTGLIHGMVWYAMQCKCTTETPFPLYIPTCTSLHCY